MVVVTATPLMAVVPAASVVTLRSGLPLPPTTPPKVVVPESLTIRLWAVAGDCTVELNVTPAPASVVSSSSVTAPKAAPVVAVIVPARLVAPAV